MFPGGYGTLYRTLGVPDEITPPDVSYKTRKLWRKIPRGNKHSLFLMTPTETITAELRGTSRPDFHLDSHREEPTAPSKKTPAAFSSVAWPPPGSWVGPLSSEEKALPLKGPVPRRLFRLRPSEENNESPRLRGGGGGCAAT